MSTKKTNHTQEQKDQFIDNCHYLGLKLLAEEYPQIVDKAGKDTLGYYEFIRGIVQAEAAARQQRRIEYLVKTSRLPQPLNMLAGFDFDFQPRLDRRLVMDLASLGCMKRRWIKE
ncbi:MAG: ATP-binding protein [Bacteroidales bacterium]